MSLEKRIRDELHDTAERLALDPGEYRRAMELGARRRRQRIGLILGGAVGLAAIVFAANAIEIGGSNEPGILAGSTASILDSTTQSTLAPVPPVSTAPPVTTPALREIGESVAVASTDGISVFDPGQEGAVLTGDPHYQSISWVVTDGEGGMIYTHEVTPLPWEQGSLMRLPAGSANPTALVAPEGGGLITPIGVDDGSVFYRLDDLAGQSSIRAIGLDGSESRVIVGPLQMSASAAVDDGMLVVGLGGECDGYQFFGTDGTQLPTPDWAAECGPGVGNDIALADGYLYTMSDIDGQRQLVRIDLETGNSEATPIEEGWQVEAESATRVAFGGNIIRVGDFSGNEFVEAESFLGGHGTFALLPSLTLAASPRLGSGMGELPCTPTDVPNPETTGLPAAIEEKFQLVFTLAKSCELEALGEIVLQDGAAYTFGPEEDPVQTWARSARYGFDMMPMTVRILNVPPAFDGNTYVWPGVALTDSDEDWQQLSGVLSAAELEQLYQFRDEMGYLGLRVGINTNGLLSYLITGD